MEKKVATVTILAVFLTSILSLALNVSMTSALVEPGVYTNPVPPGYGFIDFEEGVDGQVIRSTLPGLRFTTTLGYDWVYGDVRTGYYNARSLTDPSVNYGHYVLNGYFFAWLGEYMGQGRIDFVDGTASYFSVLTSTYSGLSIDAYDSNDNLIATSGWAIGNLYTYTFTRLTVQAPNMAYVIIHDTGNYWLIDDLVTDAGGVERAYTYEKDGLEQLDQNSRAEWRTHWCGPTAAGTSLAWFAEHGGAPELVPDPEGDGIDEEDKYDVIDTLGNNYMNTDPLGGTTDADFIKGLQDYIKDHGDYAFTVTPFKNPTYQQFVDELTAGEDVLLGIPGHWVVGRAVNENPPPQNVGIMDPGTGSFEDTTWDDLQSDLMISVSPVGSPTSYDEKLYGYVVVVDGMTYVINGTYFGEVYIVDGQVFGVVDGTVYNTTGTVYGFANRTVIIVDGTYFPVTGSVYIINGTQIRPTLPYLFPDHDIAISEIKPTKTVVGEGYVSQFNVIARNMGTENETSITVTVYANTTVIGVQTISSLARGTFTPLVFTWNTSVFAKGSYTISASATSVPGETDLSDNALTDGVVQVTIAGDINGDSWVDGEDLTSMGMTWGSTIGQPNYKPNADINSDDWVDGSDLTIMGFNWGQYDP